MPAERRGPVRSVSDNTEGRGAMTTAPISLQDLRRRLYVKAKAEKDWRVWGPYGHVGKLGNMHTAYSLAKADFSLQWLTEHENVIFCGPVGVGKSWFAQALGHSACRAFDERLISKAQTA